MHAEEPFRFEAIPGKLPKQVVPTDYAVRIVPDIDRFVFTGTETIKLDVRAPVHQLVLNTLELKITRAGLDGKPLSASAIKTDNRKETLTVALGGELIAGPHTLELSFEGKINEQGQGLFYARYQEQGTGMLKTLLGTQFEATDARRFFPCWDEPSFRARFQLTVVVPETWLAVSNMPIEHEDKAATPPRSKELRFATTPLMASYLNVFVAGELESIETQVGSTQVRVITTKGKAEQGRYALDSSVKILRYYNDYFGVPYPLPKLDQIAIPGGFGGAMENWGGITYFESALLFDPAKSSENTKQLIFEVLAHEMAHMWFGDLVTMAWWDNLWLNEGFASWMGSKCTAHFNPQWEVWLHRNIQRDPTRRTGIPKELAMEGDARSTTHPIQQPVATEANANSAFDDITYRKGQSFIRMLESFLGEDAFRDGIQRYIAAHKYSNSTTADLWNALGEASGKPVREIAAKWTEQPGLPLVTVRRQEDNNVALSQQRFVVHFPNAPDLTWPIPLSSLVAGQGPVHSRLMTAKTDSLPDIAADQALKVNAGGAGNYRVEYDPASWKLLLEASPKLSVDDRVNLLGDAWALVQADRAQISSYFDLVGRLPTKTELAERDQIIDTLEYINGLLIGHPAREKFQKYARSILQPTFDEIGWTPQPGESPKIATLRSSLIAALGALNDQQIIDGCRERFQKYLTDPESLPPDLRGAVFFVVGHYADEPTWNKLHGLGLNTTSIEEKQYYYDALAAALDPKLARKTLAISLTDELPTSRAVFLIGKVAKYSDHPDLAREFAKANLKPLLAKTDALGENRFAPSLFVFDSDPARAIELKNYAKAKLPATNSQEVAKVIDEVQFRAEFKQRLVSQLASIIESQPSK